ncbi:MAG: hypothetical protein QOH93_1996 [Chloroflexia bacterium]|jgi:hypothetical protein|nr:hypothetical protein [Chloroflexia bacterium]
MKGNLYIDRLNATYMVPRDVADWGAITHRLDASLSKDVGLACAQVLSRAVPPNSNAVWLIRAIDLDLLVDVGAATDGDIATLWGRNLGSSIALALAQGPDGENVLCFRDRADYLAQFLRDLSSGGAWSKWYYSSFDSLRILPTGAVAREALLREPGEVVPVLLQLHQSGHMEQLLNVLGDNYAQGVYEAALDGMTGTGGMPLRDLVEVLVNLWHETGVREGPSGFATATNALRLVIGTWQNLSTMADTRGMREAVGHLLRLADLLATRGGESESLASRLMWGDMHSALELVRAHGPREHVETLAFFAGLSGGDNLWVAQVAQAVGDLGAMGINKTPQDGPDRLLSTRFGGVFLLLPSLLEAGIEELFSEVSGTPDDQQGDVACLRAWVLAKCLGHTRATDALHDSAVRLVAGVVGHIPERCKLLEGAGATASFSRALSELLVQRGYADGRYIVADLADTPAGRVVVLRDVRHDAWLHASFVEEDASHERAIVTALMESIREVVEATGIAPEYIVLGDTLSERIDVDLLPGGQPGYFARAIRPAEGLDSLPGETRDLVDTFMSRAKPVDDELSYLLLGGLDLPVALSGEADLCLAMLAHALLRRFSAHLLGFGWSRAEHIYSNFLTSEATISESSARLDVRLSRCPLHVVLSLAGLDEQSYELPWLGGREVHLAMQD